MFFSKKAEIEWGYIIGTLLGVIILIMMISYITDIFGSGYDTSVMECNFFMSNVNGVPSYFGEGSREITYKFLGTVASICPMKNVEVEEDKLNDLAKLVGSCYKAMGSGKDFFGPNVEDKSICMNCGFMNVEENVVGFNSKFSKVLDGDKFKTLWKNDSELINGNFITLGKGNFPKDVSSGETYMVVYYAYKPDSGGVSDSISAFFGKYITTTGSYLFSSNNAGGVSGIVLNKWDENIDFKTDKNLSFYNSGISIGCDRVITPQDFS